MSKFVKVTITKSISGGKNNYVYPTGYDKNNIIVEGYQHKIDPSLHNKTEFLLGIASADFTFNTDIVELTEAEYSIELAAITPATV